jgi:hypothetical protein
MGAEGVEPTRPCDRRIFIPSYGFRRPELLRFPAAVRTAYRLLSRFGVWTIPSPCSLEVDRGFRCCPSSLFISTLGRARRRDQKDCGGKWGRHHDRDRGVTNGVASRRPALSVLVGCRGLTRRISRWEGRLGFLLCGKAPVRTGLFNMTELIQCSDNRRIGVSGGGSSHRVEYLLVA